MIRQLDERHRTLAEELLKGTTKAKIAELLGINRQTIYDWMKDPLFVQYFNSLAREVQMARTQRLLPVTMKVAEVLEAALDRAQAEIETGAEGRPSLDAVSVVAKRLFELERNDRGLPTREEKAQSSKTDTASDERLLTALDRLVGTRPEEQN